MEKIVPGTYDKIRQILVIQIYFTRCRYWRIIGKVVFPMGAWRGGSFDVQGVSGSSPLASTKKPPFSMENGGFLVAVKSPRV